MVNILFVSSPNMIAPDLARRLKEEGHHVKLYLPVSEHRGQSDFDGLVEKTKDWRRELDWVGKEGLIVFDDTGEGKTQTELRSQGYSVFGGCQAGDRLESDRVFAQEILGEYGLNSLEAHTFHQLDEAIAFAKKNPQAWVIKQNGRSSKSLNYVPAFNDGRDTINVLESYGRIPKYKLRSVTLQKKVQGVEIGVGRYFNGKDWVGPIEINIEHKKLFPGDLGPTTSEMGTLAWYDDDENNKLFTDTLAKIKPHLAKIDYRGDIDINCIVNSEGVFPLEITPRFGSPIIHLHDELHQSPWGELLRAVANGENYPLRWRRGYGVVVMIVLPPFPYSKQLKDFLPAGLHINFKSELSEEEWRHIHFEEVAAKQVNGQKQFFASGTLGYVMYVTGTSETVSAAREKTYGLIKKIHIPKMFYRNDIGERFERETKQQLTSLGYNLGSR